MKCSFHHERNADFQCNSCFKPLCSECTVEINGKKYCRECIPPVREEKPYFPQPTPYTEHLQPFQPFVPSPPPTSSLSSSVQHRKSKEKIAVVGGSFLVVAGGIGLLTPLLLFSVFSPAGLLYEFYSSVSGYLLLGFVLPLIFSTSAVIGGFSALQKKNYHFAVIGGVLGILTWGFYISSILSILGLILILIANEEFGGKS
jgi:hypothetical protein